MTTARFKSQGDYFSKRSNLARQVIEHPASMHQKSTKKESTTSVMDSLISDLFCRTVDSFEVEGRGHFTADEYSLDEAIFKHLAGDETLKVNPLSKSGETVWNVMRFVLSDSMDHPFTKAKQFADELQRHGIRSLIEVAEGGKGDYHLWVFHAEPVDGRALARALVRLGQKMFGMALETAPSLEGDVYIPLPLQGESLLFQRRVFVNAVGKMIKDQVSVLRTAPLNPPQAIASFIAELAAEPEKERIEAKPHPRPSVTPSLHAERGTGGKVKLPWRSPQAEQVTEPSQSIEARVLVCIVMGADYGIDANSVLRIGMPGDLTPVPGAAPVIGTVRDNGTGKIIPVLDAAYIFGEKRSRLLSHSRILIIRGKSGSTALLVDGVSGIRDASIVREKTGTGDAVSYTSGFFSFAGQDGNLRRILRIDPEALISYTGVGTGKKEPGTERYDNRFVVFSVNGLRCGFPAESVREIIVPYDFENAPTHPKTGPVKEGVMHYGKDYLPVIDVQRILDGPADFANGTGAKRRIIVVKSKNRLIGAAVTSIESVRTIMSGLVDPAPAALIDRIPIIGFARETEQSPAFIILDPDRLV